MREEIGFFKISINLQIWSFAERNKQRCAMGNINENAQTSLVCVFGIGMEHKSQKCSINTLWCTIV